MFKNIPSFSICFEECGDGSIVLVFKHLGVVTHHVCGRKALEGMLDLIHAFRLRADKIFITEYKVYFIENVNAARMNGNLVEMSRDNYERFKSMFIENPKPDISSDPESKKEGYFIRFSDGDVGIDVDAPLVLFYNDNKATKMIEGIEAVKLILELVNAFDLNPLKILEHEYEVLFDDFYVVEIKGCGQLSLTEADYMRFISVFESEE